MTAQQVHDALKDHIGYQWSREHADALNMMLVLKAHGFRYSLLHAEIMISFVPE